MAITLRIKNWKSSIGNLINAEKVLWIGRIVFNIYYWIHIRNPSKMDKFIIFFFYLYLETIKNKSNDRKNKGQG